MRELFSAKVRRGRGLRRLPKIRDDVNLALPIDEDGVVSRQTDLIVTVGTVPTITLRATNTSGLARGTFNFTVNDAGMGIVSAPMTINVTAVNDVLVAQPRTVTTNEDTAKTFAYSDFPVTDVEGNGLVSITVSGLSLAAGDTLLVNKGAGLLGIMAFGQHEGSTERDPEVRRLFTREALLASDWYRERLTTKQQRDIALWQRHYDDLAKALTEYGEANVALADTIRQRQVIAAAQLARVQRPEYMTELIGTLGAEPLI